MLRIGSRRAAGEVLREVSGGGMHGRGAHRGEASGGRERRGGARRALSGVVAGVVGTVAMTSLMKGRASRWFPPDRLPREFVPKQIIERVEEAAAAPGALSEAQEMRLTMPAHYGYGGSMGAVYGAVRSRLAGLPAPLAGALFGLGVWAFGYAGWLPAIGVKEGTAGGPRRRMIAPLIGHLVFGATTALAYEALER